MLSASKISYTPIVTAVLIDNKVKTVCASAADPGLAMWESVIEEIYKDFSSVFSKSIMLYLKSLNVELKPVMANVINITFDISAISSKSKNTAKNIHNSIKSKMATFPPDLVERNGGKIKFTTMMEYITKDVSDVFSISLITSLNSASILCPPGVLIPGSNGTTAPGTLILKTPYTASAIKSELQNNFSDYISIGEKISKAVKGSPNDPAWKHVIDNLKDYIPKKVELSFKNYILKTNNFQLPPAIPMAISAPPFTIPSPSPFPGINK